MCTVFASAVWLKTLLSPSIPWTRSKGIQGRNDFNVLRVCFCIFSRRRWRRGGAAKAGWSIPGPGEWMLQLYIRDPVGFWWTGWCTWTALYELLQLFPLAALPAAFLPGPRVNLSFCSNRSSATTTSGRTSLERRCDLYSIRLLVEAKYAVAIKGNI